MSEILAFPVFLFSESNLCISLSNKLNNNRILTMNEAYSLLLENKGLFSFTFSQIHIDVSATQIRLNKQTKELYFQIKMNSEYAEVKCFFEFSGNVYITFEELNLARKTGYFIYENKCFPLDSESLIFSNELLFENGFQLQLNIALNYFAQRENFPLLKFENEEFNIKDITVTGRYDIDSSLFIGNLYGYQKDGFSWLLYCCINRLGGILADDMGLGKTVQVIALIAAIIEKNLLGQILIVVPGTLLENWRREFVTFAPTIIPYIHHGSQRRGSPTFLKKHRIIITSYSMIINDEFLFNKIEWGLTILDEASLIKNPESQRRISINKLKSDVRIVMTGTPVENSLIDLWSLADFVYPGYLGLISEFSTRYISKNISNDINSGNLLRLKNDVSYIMLRRKKEDVLEYLPERIDIHQALIMHENEIVEYNNKQAEVVSSATNGSNGTIILKLITELRMYTTHPRLKSEGGIHSASLSELKNESFKFSRTLELVHEISVKKEKVLIFTEFLGMIDTLQRIFTYEYKIKVFTIDGRIPTEERQLAIDSFSEIDGFSIMILNPRTGGMGLNITAANHVIHYTRQWNPALEQQASARAYRNGQKKGVNIYYLFYTNTIEEVIDNRLRLKMALSQEVITVTETDDNMQEYINILIKSQK